MNSGRPTESTATRSTISTHPPARRDQQARVLRIDRQREQAAPAVAERGVAVAARPSASRSARAASSAYGLGASSSGSSSARSPQAAAVITSGTSDSRWISGSVIGARRAAGLHSR